MSIIHSMNTNTLPRLVTQNLHDRLRVMPAVVVTGARQTGKSTMAQELAQRAEPDGAHLENLVLHDLLAWRDARLDRAEILYWRTAVGEEVDFVIEAGGCLLPIEVKATDHPRLGDATHLRTFRAEYREKARAGLLLHVGRTLAWLAPDVLAAPWWRML